MKLPDIAYVTRVTDLSKRSPFLPVTEAKTEVAATKSVATAAAAVGEIAANIYGRTVQMARDKAALDATRFEADLLVEHENKTEYSPSELPDNLQSYHPSGTATIRQGYEVKPDLLKQSRIQKADELAATIPDAEAAADFRNAYIERIEKQYVKDMLVAQGEQVEQQQILQADLIQEFMQKGNYNAAREVAANFVDKSKRQTLKFGIDKQEETDPIYQAMAANDVPMMEIQLAKMKSPEYDGTLLNKEREMLAGQLEAEIYKAGKADRDAREASDKRLKWTGRRIRDSLYAGYEVSLKRVEETALALIGVDDELASEISEAVTFQKYSARLSRMSPSQQFAELERARSHAGESEGAALFHSKLEGVVNRNMAAMERDAIAHAVRTGQVQHVEFDANDIAGSLRRMAENEQIIFENNGVSTGIMTQQQAIEFANILSSAPTSQLPALFAEIETGLGSQSYKVYEQLKSEGLAGQAAIAGQIFSEGDYAASNILVSGQQLRKQFPKALSKIDSDLNEMIANEIGFVFGDKPNEAKWRTQAVKDAYLFFVANDADADAMPLSVDKEVFQSALVIAAPVVEINGRKIEPAYRGQPEDQMQSYADNISVPTLHLMGNPVGFSYRQLQQGIQNDDIEIISAGKNKYYLYHPATNAYVRDQRTGGLFNFSFIDNPHDYEPNETVRPESSTHHIAPPMMSDRLMRRRRTVEKLSPIPNF